MRYLLLIFISLTVFAGDPVSSGDPITAKKFNDQTFMVGDIKQSLLDLPNFQALAGDCWVKMAGQDVSGSDYSTLMGITNLPNTAGRFLRDVGGNALGLGQVQSDSLQGHGHNFYGDTTAGVASGSSQPRMRSNTANNALINTDNVRGYTVDGANGTPRVSNETRPVNISVNYFVKINYECN